MQHRTIHRDQHHFGWDNSIAPIAEVAPGDVVELELIDSSGGQLTPASTAAALGELDFARVNPVAGPLYVHGAEPGDALEIEILDFTESSWGWTGIIPGFGLLADDFSSPFFHISTYDAEYVEFLPHIRLPTRAFTGTIGVAPAEAGVHSVVPPRHVGGNMDLRDITRGARLFLPVEVTGALLSVGDTHAAQGDGEVCGTAVETAMTVRLRTRVHKQTHLRRPRLEVPAGVDAGQSGWTVTTGIGPDLMAAAKDAVRDMIEHLGREYKLDSELAYCLCSAAVSLRISEIVDMPNWLVSAYLPKSIFV